jgi:hypothetical protein
LTLCVIHVTIEVEDIIVFKLSDKVVIKDTVTGAERYNNQIGIITQIRHVPGEKVSDGVPFTIYYVKWENGVIEMYLHECLLHYTKLHSLLKRVDS